MAKEQEINISNKKGLLQFWKEEIRSGVRYRMQYGKAAEWKLYKNMYRGFWDRGVVPVNIIYAIGRSLIPQIYFRDPRVAVYPKLPGYAPHAMILERIDNHLIQETNIKYEMKSNALDSYLCGVGPGILGYDSEYGFNPSFAVGKEYEDSGLTSFSKTGEKIEYTDNIRPGMPWYMRCNPEDFIVPWGTNKWENARWFALRKMRTLRDIKEDPKYKNTSNLKAPYKTKMEGSTDGHMAGSPRQGVQDSDSDWVELFEIHDKRTGRVYALTLDHDKFLRDEIDYLQYDCLPARVLGFNEDPNYFWWAPDARLIKVQQDEINDIRTMAKKHRRVGLLKMLADKGIKDDELDKLLDGDPKAVARIDVGSQGDIRKMVAMLQSHVPPDLISYAREVREDIREIIGFSRNQMGSFESPSGRRTAHEAEIVRAAALIRIDERRDIMADHLSSIVKGYNQMIFSNWTVPRVVDIIGPDGKRYWVKFTGEQIRGNFAYKINPEEQVPQNQQTRRQDAEKFIELAKLVPGMDMGYITRQWAKTFDWLDPQMLMPNEGAGRSPEKALSFTDFQAKIGAGTPSVQGLGG